MKRVLPLSCCLFLGVAYAADPTPPSAPATVYEPGWVASLNPFEKKGKWNYKGRLDKTIGKFVLTKNPFDLSAHQEDPALSFVTEPVGYTAQALFEAKKKGDYVFIAELVFPPSLIYRDPQNLKQHFSSTIACDYQLLIKNQRIVLLQVTTDPATPQAKRCGFTEQSYGTAKLPPGLYEVTMQLGCVGLHKGYNPDFGTTFYRPRGCPNEGKAFEIDSWAGDQVTASLRIRRPNENAPSLAKPEDFFHIGKSD